MLKIQLLDISMLLHIKLTDNKLLRNHVYVYHVKIQHCHPFTEHLSLMLQASSPSSTKSTRTISMRSSFTRKSVSICILCYQQVVLFVKSCLLQKLESQPDVRHVPHHRNNVVLDQNDVFTQILEPFAANKDIDYQFKFAVLTEYLKSLDSLKIKVKVSRYDIFSKRYRQL